MDLDIDHSWELVTDSSQLGPGQLISATVGDTGLLIMIAQPDGGSPFPLILKIDNRGSGQWYTPPMAQLSWGDLTRPYYRYVGKPPKIVLAGIPLPTRSFKPGELLIDQVNEPWLAFMDYPDGRPYASNTFCNLKTGIAQDQKPAGVVYPKWSLCTLSADEHIDQTLVQFGD